MFALGIRYLCGRVTATHPADRERAEWPPHPDRLFMALVAAHGETGCTPAEREALLWLEQQSPPALVASDCCARTVVTSYVPTNDTKMPRWKPGKEPSPTQVKEGLSLFPETRLRNARYFPAITPERDEVHLLWSTEPPSAYRKALAALCAKVTYLGHSSSLVQCWVVDDEVANRLQPVYEPVGSKPGRFRLRVSSAGRFEELHKRFEAGLRPTSSLWAGYERVPSAIGATPCHQSVFDANLLVLRSTDGRPLGLESTLQITQTLRKTLMSKCPVQPAPEWLSGHAANGSSSEHDHIAFLSLPHVGREHADGHLVGVALAVPRGVTAEEQSRCWLGLLYDQTLGMPQKLELQMGPLGVWAVELDDREQRPVALRPETWTDALAEQPARRWGTVTPIALDRHPKGDAPWKEMEETIMAACIRIGLPAPTNVILSSVSMFIGAPHARSFPCLQRKSGGNIHHTHAIMTFAEPVCGPMLLGAGRYRGYGFCRPLRPREDAA